MEPDRLEDVLETDIGAGRGVFRPATNTAIVLNESAARIWDLARNGLTIEEVARQIAAECGVDAESLRVPVSETVDDLVHGGLLTVDDSAS